MSSAHGSGSFFKLSPPPASSGGVIRARPSSAATRTAVRGPNAGGGGGGGSAQTTLKPKPQPKSSPAPDPVPPLSATAAAAAAAHVPTNPSAIPTDDEDVPRPRTYRCRWGSQRIPLLAQSVHEQSECSKCPDTLIYCPFSGFGCEAGQFPRRDKPQHMTDFLSSHVEHALTGLVARDTLIDRLSKSNTELTALVHRQTALLEQLERSTIFASPEHTSGRWENAPLPPPSPLSAAVAAVASTDSVAVSSPLAPSPHQKKGKGSAVPTDFKDHKHSQPSSVQSLIGASNGTGTGSATSFLTPTTTTATAATTTPTKSDTAAAASSGGGGGGGGGGGLALTAVQTSGIWAGEANRFIVSGRDKNGGRIYRGGDPITAMVVGDRLPNDIRCRVIDRGDGSYDVEVRPPYPVSRLSLEVRIGWQMIRGSPFAFIASTRHWSHAVPLLYKTKLICTAPRTVCIDPHTGRIYVGDDHPNGTSDPQLNTVNVWSNRPPHSFVCGSANSGLGSGFAKVAPCPARLLSMAIDCKRDRLYIDSHFNRQRRILVFAASNGKFITAWEKRCGSIAVDSNTGYVYVIDDTDTSDGGLWSRSVLDPETGQTINSWSLHGDAPPLALRATDTMMHCAFDSVRRHLIVLDCIRMRVHVYSCTSTDRNTFLCWWNLHDPHTSVVEVEPSVTRVSPHAGYIAVDPNGLVYVAGVSCILVYAWTGGLIATVGTTGPETSQFQSLAGIAVSRKYVYAVDRRTRRVEVFTVDPDWFVASKALLNAAHRNQLTSSVEDQTSAALTEYSKSDIS